MQMMFEVTYLDPRNGVVKNIEGYTVLARNAAEAIRRANSLRTFRYLKPQSVQLIGVADK